MNHPRLVVPGPQAPPQPRVLDWPRCATLAASTLICWPTHGPTRRGPTAPSGKVRNVPVGFGYEVEVNAPFNGVELVRACADPAAGCRLPAATACCG